MSSTEGWHRIMRGWYRYTNASGKELAQVYRHGGRWEILIYPMADAARARTLRDTESTYRDAKALAQREYLAATRSEMKRERETIERLRTLGLLETASPSKESTKHDSPALMWQAAGGEMKIKPRTLRRAKYFNGYITSDGRYEIKAGYGLSIRGGSVSRPTSWTLIDRKGEFEDRERPLLSDIRDVLRGRP